MYLGIMPYEVAIKYGVNLTRKVVYTSSWLGWFASAYKQRVLLNVNYSSDQGSFAPDLNAFKSKLLKIKNTLKPEFITIQNEEDLQSDLTGYLDELKAAASVCPVTNGGMTQQHLGYFYYQQTQDADFFKNNVNQKAAYNDGVFSYNIEAVKTELDVIKSLKLPYFNVHYYIGYATQAPGLVRMYRWVQQYLGGMPLMCNEAGIYRSGLIPYVVDVATQCNMTYLILYSGTGVEGSGKALPISLNDLNDYYLLTQ